MNERDDLITPRQAKSLQDGVDMVLDRAQRDTQRRRDFSIGRAFGDGAGDLPLPSGQPVKRRRLHPPLRDGTWRYLEPEDLENPRVGTGAH